jgi:hypothetical protein
MRYNFFRRGGVDCEGLQKVRQATNGHVPDVGYGSRFKLCGGAYKRLIVGGRGGSVVAHVAGWGVDIRYTPVLANVMSSARPMMTTTYRVPSTPIALLVIIVSIS